MLKFVFYFINEEWCRLKPQLPQVPPRLSKSPDPPRTPGSPWQMPKVPVLDQKGTSIYGGKIDAPQPPPLYPFLPSPILISSQWPVKKISPPCESSSRSRPALSRGDNFLVCRLVIVILMDDSPIPSNPDLTKKSHCTERRRKLNSDE